MEMDTIPSKRSEENELESLHLGVGLPIVVNDSQPAPPPAIPRLTQLKRKLMEQANKERQRSH